MTCAYPHCNLPEDHDGPHGVLAADMGITAAAADREQAALLASEEADGYEADETGLTPVDPAPELGRAAIEKAHRRYAFGQLKATRNNMARDLHRDMAEGKFTNEAMLWRAQARLKSYDDLIDLLERLKDVIK